MRTTVKKASYEMAINQGELFLEELKKDPLYEELLNGCKEKGLALQVSFSYGFTDDFYPAYTPDKRASGLLPKSFALGLQLDFVKDNHVVAIRDEEGRLFPCSFVYPIITQTESFIFFSFQFRPFTTILQDNPGLNTLLSFLETYEEKDFIQTALPSNNQFNEYPSDLFMLKKEEIGDGTYVEITSHPFEENTFGYENSLYFNPRSFLPYELLISSALEYKDIKENPYYTFSSDEIDLLIDHLQTLHDEIQSAYSFSYLFDEEFSLPLFVSTDVETFLNEITIYQQEHFLNDVDAFIEFLKDAQEQSTPVTILW